jgi:hypothetical protein
MEKIIKLKAIDHTKKTVNEAIGVTKEELRQCAKEVLDYPAFVFDKEAGKLGFKKEEIIEAIQNHGTTTKSIVSLWQGKKEEITLHEFVLTLVLAKRTVEEYEEESPAQFMQMFDRLTNRMIGESVDNIKTSLEKLIKESGTEVLLDTPACEKWKKEHNGNSKGCSGHLGCTKLSILTDVIDQLSSRPARFAENPIENAFWLNAIVRAFVIATKVLAAKDLDELEKNLEDVEMIQKKKTEIKVE